MQCDMWCRKWFVLLWKLFSDLCLSSLCRDESIWSPGQKNGHWARCSGSFCGVSISYFIASDMQRLQYTAQTAVLKKLQFAQKEFLSVVGTGTFNVWSSVFSSKCPVLFVSLRVQSHYFPPPSCCRMSLSSFITHTLHGSEDAVEWS